MKMTLRDNDNVCDGCDRDHEDLTLRAGRGLCPDCLSVCKETEKRVVDEIISMLKNCCCTECLIKDIKEKHEKERDK